jgi:magnesium-protoporphyrin IX monomethyl ester (oxidative) cyclase
MRADPKLTTGFNRLWIRFFLLAVYATMYVRDHRRPVMHAAMGLEPRGYDYQVFDITSAISKQIFPFTLDTDHAEFRRLLEKLRLVMEDIETAKQRGGLSGLISRVSGSVQAGVLFIRLYMRPVIHHDVPHDVRLAPSW